MATNTPPAAWWDEPAEVIATVVDLLEARAESHRPHKSRGRRGR